MIKGNGAVPMTLNQYGYCRQNPLLWVDFNGCNFINGALIKLMIAIIANDRQGEYLMQNYVYGNGEDVYINNEEWAEYMMANKTLKEKTGYYLYPIALNMQPGETKEIDIEIPMIIDGKGKKSGYMLLYGSNSHAGNYQIKGTVSRDETGAATYDLTYTFNDVMDPDFTYRDDIIEYSILFYLKQNVDKSITMKNYDIHISWSDKTIINYVNLHGEKNEGWLAEMQNLNVSEMRDFVETVKKNSVEGSANYETAILMEKFLNDYIKYVEEHPNYYGCIFE